DVGLRRHRRERLLRTLGGEFGGQVLIPGARQCFFACHSHRLLSRRTMKRGREAGPTRRGSRPARHGRPPRKTSSYLSRGSTCAKMLPPQPTATVQRMSVMREICHCPTDRTRVRLLE